ncbi:unnamed protein product, partial [marine sediment metagenome]
MVMPNLEPLAIGNGQSGRPENKSKETGISRREFVGALGAGVGGICLLGTLNTITVLADSTAQQKAILYDSTLCIGCHTCEQACKQVNNLEGEITIGGDLSSNTWLKVDLIEFSQAEGGWLFIRRACTHCGTCVSVCPAGAISKREGGMVVVNQDKCIGCHYCFEACPLDIPRYGEDGTMRKCDFCFDRLELGKEPACVEACPVNALIYGDRDKLVVEGRERV